MKAAAIILGAALALFAGNAIAQDSSVPYFCVAYKIGSESYWYTRLFSAPSKSRYDVELAWQSYAFANLKANAGSPYCTSGRDTGDASSSRASMLTSARSAANGNKIQFQEVDWSYGE